MALIKCPECGKEVSNKALACIHCGCPLETGVDNVEKNTMEESSLETASDVQVEEVEEQSVSGVEEEIKQEESDVNNLNEEELNVTVDAESPVMECAVVEKTESETKIPFYQKTWFVIVALILFLPVGVFLVWKYKKFKKPVRIVCYVALVIWLVFKLIPCIHEWSEATCTEPKTCTLCGKAEGEALGHEWNEATCTEPKTCNVCGETEGDALGHNAEEWKVEKEATCTEEGIQKGKCVQCGQEVEAAVEKVEHTPGEWEVTKKATATAKGEKSQLCSVCGEVLATEEYEMSAKEIKKAFKEECESYSYNEIARNPDKYDGKSAKFTGEVIQVMEDGDDYTLRVNVTKGKYYWDDTVLVSYTRKDDDEPRILEDDIIVMYGTLAGTHTYESVMGASITVPLFFAEYVDFK